MNHWIIDQRIDATALAAANGWHLASTIEALRSEGLDQHDAECFASFLFTEAAEVRDHEPEEHVSEAQWSRLSLAFIGQGTITTPEYAKVQYPDLPSALAAGHRRLWSFSGSLYA